MQPDSTAADHDLNTAVTTFRNSWNNKSSFNCCGCCWCPVYTLVDRHSSFVVVRKNDWLCVRRVKLITGGPLCDALPSLYMPRRQAHHVIARTCSCCMCICFSAWANCYSSLRLLENADNGLTAERRTMFGVNLNRHFFEQCNVWMAYDRSCCTRMGKLFERGKEEKRKNELAKARKPNCCKGVWTPIVETSGWL